MKTILNVALGAALGFCIIFFAAGPFENYVDSKIEEALAERLGAVEQSAPAEKPAEVAKPTAKAVKATSKPIDNREYIEVRSSKTKAKLYIGQPKTEILELLGTPDSFDFGGTSERCTYEFGMSDWYVLRFRNGKLTEVDKY